LGSTYFSAAFAGGLTLGSAFLYFLVKGYGDDFFCFVVYGLPLLELAAAILSHGSISIMNEVHPRILEGLHLTGCYIITAVQFGFFFFYLSSRGLVSKSSVRRCCTVYHPSLCLLYFFRLQYGQWWKCAPGPVLLQTAILSFGGLIKLFVGCYSNYVSNKPRRQLEIAE
jgi:hypothetical protein